jgi:uncharacterized heparinase superfamily protein
VERSPEPWLKSALRKPGRCWNWLRCGAALLEAGNDEARTARIDSLTRQLRYVQETIGAAHDPKSRWLGAVVLVAGSLCLRSGAGLTDALDRLEAETTAQILPDGGHVTRSPAHILSSLLHLQTLADALERAGRPVPDWMEKWIPRMGAMLAFFQAGDGALNTFHDGDESRAEVVGAALARLPSPPRKFMFAPKSGFQKVEKGGLRLVLDCGEAPPRPFGDHARQLQVLTLAAERPVPANTMYVARWRERAVCTDAATLATPLAPGELRIILPGAREQAMALMPGAAADCAPLGDLLACRISPR